MENIITSEICIKCAECCKNYPFVELSQHEIFKLEKMTGLPSGDFSNPKGRAVEEYFLDFKENGDCIFLNEKNSEYSCGVYEARSVICRKYPAKKVRMTSVIQIEKGFSVKISINQRFNSERNVIDGSRKSWHHSFLPS